MTLSTEVIAKLGLMSTGFSAYFRRDISLIMQSHYGRFCPATDPNTHIDIRLTFIP